ISRHRLHSVSDINDVLTYAITSVLRDGPKAITPTVKRLAPTSNPTHTPSGAALGSGRCSGTRARSKPCRTNAPLRFLQIAAALNSATALVAAICGDSVDGPNGADGYGSLHGRVVRRPRRKGAHAVGR